MSCLWNPIGILMKRGLASTISLTLWNWWPLGDLNPRPIDYESTALTN